MIILCTRAVDVKCKCRRIKKNNNMAKREVTLHVKVHCAFKCQHEDSDPECEPPSGVPRQPRVRGEHTQEEASDEPRPLNVLPNKPLARPPRTLPLSSLVRGKSTPLPSLAFGFCLGDAVPLSLRLRQYWLYACWEFTLFGIEGDSDYFVVVVPCASMYLDLRRAVDTFFIIVSLQVEDVVNLSAQTKASWWKH